MSPPSGTKSLPTVVLAGEYDEPCYKMGAYLGSTARRVLGGRPTLYEWEDSLRQLAVPTVVLAGEYDEPCYKMGAYLARTIPDAEFTVIPGVGHFMNLEAPTEFNA